MARSRILTALILALVALAWPVTAHAEPISAAIASGIAAATGLSATGAGVTLAASIITGVLGTALTSAISFGISAIVGKPKGGGAGGWADRATAMQTVSKSAIETRKIVIGRVRTSGSLALLRASGGKGNAWLYIIMVLADHLCEEIEEIYLDEKAIEATLFSITLNGVDYYWTTSSDFKASGIDGHSAGNELVRVSHRLGSDDQVAEPFLVDDRYKTPNNRAIEKIGWTEDHRLRGVCNIFLELLFSEDKFRNGTPNITALFKGAADMYDPRDGSTGYSNNWALGVRYYLKRILADAGLDESYINDESVIAAANISDEDVNLKDGGTQKRYTIDGVIDTAQPIPEVLEQLGTCGNGAIIWTQGQWHVFAGAYDTPSHTVNQDWYGDGDTEVIPRPSRDEAFNAIKGVYMDGDGDNPTWQPVDFPEITNATFEEQDGGQRIYNDVEFPFVINSERAQRLATSILKRHRQSITVKRRLNYRGLAIRPWDTIELTDEEFGWTNKVFRVMEWEFVPGEGVDVTLREESSDNYDWDPNDAIDVDNAPDSNFDIENVPEPGAVTITESLYNSTEGSGVKVKVDIEWTEPDDNAYLISDYLVGFKLTTDSEYTVQEPVRGSRITLYDVSPGTYNFRVIARNALGVKSDPVVKTKEIIGLTALPAQLTGLALTAINNQAHLRWDQSSDLDVLVGGSIRVKHTSLTSGGSWETATQIVDDLSGISTAAVVPLLDGTYFLKAVDSVGNESQDAATIQSTIVNLLNLNVIKTVQQDSAFAGAKTNMIVDDSTGWLKLDSAEDWDDILPGTNIDDWPGQIDSGFGTGLASQGIYVFDDGGNDYIDLGAIYKTRIMIDVDALIVSNATAWDDLYPGTNIDDWPGLIDGDEITQTTAYYELRYTDDDPSGSPTWSDWETFVIGDYEHRAYQIRVRVENGLASNNIFIKTLSAKFDTPDRQEVFEDTTVSIAPAAATPITYSTPFYSKPELQHVIQSAEEGDTVQYTHTTSGGKYTGATVRVLNAASHSSSRTLDIYVKGY